MGKLCSGLHSNQNASRDSAKEPGRPDREDAANLAARTGPVNTVVEEAWFQTADLRAAPSRAFRSLYPPRTGTAAKIGGHRLRQINDALPKQFIGEKQGARRDSPIIRHKYQSVNCLRCCLATKLISDVILSMPGAAVVNPWRLETSVGCR